MLERQESGSATLEYERNEYGALTLEGKVQEMQAHIDGLCPGCGSGWHDRYPSKQQAFLKTGEVYNFRLESGDRYIGEVSETNGTYVILRPEFSHWDAGARAPYTGRAGAFVQFNLTDKTVIYDANGEQV